MIGVFLLFTASFLAFLRRFVKQSCCVPKNDLCTWNLSTWLASSLGHAILPNCCCFYFVVADLSVWLYYAYRQPLVILLFRFPFKALVYNFLIDFAVCVGEPAWLRASFSAQVRAFCLYLVIPIFLFSFLDTIVSPFHRVPALGRLF